MQRTKYNLLLKGGITLGNLYMDNDFLTGKAIEDNGANFLVVDDLIGDTVEQVIKTYGHLYEADKVDILSKF